MTVRQRTVVECDENGCGARLTLIQTGLEHALKQASSAGWEVTKGIGEGRRNSPNSTLHFCKSSWEWISSLDGDAKLEAMTSRTVPGKMNVKRWRLISNEGVEVEQ